MCGKMRRKGKIRFHMALLICILISVMITGCGKKKIQVIIKDGQTETKLDVKERETVEKVLEQAEIPVNSKDIIIKPGGIHSKITKPDTKIIILRNAKVTVEDGDNVTELEMTGKTVQDALDKTGITLTEHDYLNHSLGASLVNGMKISVVRRLEVTVTVDGETKKCLTRAVDVESFLDEQKIAVGKSDRVRPSKTTALQEGSKITVERVSFKEVIETEPIAFNTQVEYSSEMYSDQSKEKTPGIEGEKEVTYKVTYVDGKEEKKKVVSEKIKKEPVAQVIIKGTKKRRRIVSKQKVEDCDGSGHGYYIITWSDGTVEYQDY